MALTAAQIVSLVCQICKAPGFSSQGGQFLNQTLDELVIHRDLKVNRVTQSLTIQANSYGPFNLESDYLRTYDMFYTQDSLPYFLQPASMEQFDSEFKDPSIGNYPYEYATDLSVEAQTGSGGAGYLYIYPQSSGLITITHRYMIDRADIDTPETSTEIPWMSDQNYLITKTAAKLMQITDDARMVQFNNDADNMLRTHLIMEGDEQAVVKNVKLDWRTFHNTRYLKPTKVTD